MDNLSGVFAAFIADEPFRLGIPPAHVADAAGTESVEDSVIGVPFWRQSASNLWTMPLMADCRFEAFVTI